MGSAEDLKSCYNAGRHQRLIQFTCNFQRTPYLLVKAVKGMKSGLFLSSA